MSLKVEKEIKAESVPCVLAWGDGLFVGTENGSIIAFDENLSKKATWQAHAVQVFSIAAADGKVYSASNDGGVRVWSANGEKLTEFPHADGDIGALYVYGTNVIIGDELGTVTVYENNELKAKYNVLEEVKDLQFKPPYLFTARDLDVTVTEIKPDESRNRFMTRHTMEGRAPLRVVGDRLLLMARGGNNLKLHYATVDSEFKLLHEVKVSDMIITTLDVNGENAWTGGWDGHVRKWKISDDHLQLAGDIDLGACVNALVAQSESAYVALENGKVVYVK